MKITDSFRSGTALAVQVVLPAVMVFGARALILNGGPASASASQAGANDPVAIPQVAPEDFSLTPTDTRQIEDAKLIADQPIARDPFVSSFLTSEDSAVAKLLPIGVEPPAPPPAAPKAPAIRLSSIISGRTTVAVVNDRVSKVGDKIDDDWKLIEINTAANSITIEHTTGLQETFKLVR